MTGATGKPASIASLYPRVFLVYRALGAEREYRRDLI